MIYKNVRIPDEELDNIVEKLGVSLEAAAQMWLEDNEVEDNKVVKELTQKAKDNKITSTIHGAKGEGTGKKRKIMKKEDIDKKKLIEILKESLSNVVNELVVSNESKVIEFEYNNNKYKLDLIKRREKGE